MPDKDTELPDIVDISDEDFDKMATPDFTALDDKDKDDKGTEDSKEDGKADEDTKGADEDEDEGTDDDLDKDKKDDDKEDDSDKDDDSKKDDKEESDTKDKKKSEGIDYEAEYKRVMGTFKASGRDVTPKTVDDAIRLMQQGAGFHDNQAKMKPAKAVMKMLENNGLLDDGKLDFLIDISKGDPEAINKLLKDHKIDPLNVDVKKETEYKRTNYAPSDADLDIDTVLEDISSSPNFDKTVDTLSETWDVTSRQEIQKYPQIIKTINEHMDNGTYDIVSDAVKYERSLGGLKGVSDLEAYRQIGSQLEKSGTFKKAPPEKDAGKDKVLDKETDPIKEAARIAAKKKAAPVRKKKDDDKKKSKLSLEDIMNMPEDEFKKLDPKKLGL